MNNKLLWTVAALVVIGALIFGLNKFYDKGQPGPSPSPSSSVGNLPVPSGGIVNTIDYSQFKGPAVCSASGKIKFHKQNIYEDLVARLKYSGIDSPARQIKWKISPADDLKIGPNLMAGLPLPDGQRSVGVVLPENPKSKSYTLTVSITYGRLEGEGIIVREVNCRGSVAVELAF